VRWARIRERKWPRWLNSGSIESAEIRGEFAQGHGHLDAVVHVHGPHEVNTRLVEFAGPLVVVGNAGPGNLIPISRIVAFDHDGARDGEVILAAASAGTQGAGHEEDQYALQHGAIVGFPMDRIS